MGTCRACGFKELNDEHRCHATDGDVCVAKPARNRPRHHGLSIRKAVLDMTLLNPPETDAEGNTRSFSIASGPNEDTLMVATRMRDTAFKRVLNWK